MGGSFFGENFFWAAVSEEMQCFTGDRGFWAAVFGHFWHGFVGLRTVFGAVWAGRGHCGHCGPAIPLAALDLVRPLIHLAMLSEPACFLKWIVARQVGGVWGEIPAAERGNDGELGMRGARAARFPRRSAGVTGSARE